MSPDVDKEATAHEENRAEVERQIREVLRKNKNFQNSMSNIRRESVNFHVSPAALQAVVDKAVDSPQVTQAVAEAVTNAAPATVDAAEKAEVSPPPAPPQSSFNLSVALDEAYKKYQKAYDAYFVTANATDIHGAFERAQKQRLGGDVSDEVRLGYLNKYVDILDMPLDTSGINADFERGEPRITFNAMFSSGLVYSPGGDQDFKQLCALVFDASGVNVEEKFLELADETVKVEVERGRRRKAVGKLIADQGSDLPKSIQDVIHQVHPGLNAGYGNSGDKKKDSYEAHRAASYSFPKAESVEINITAEKGEDGKSIRGVLNMIVDDSGVATANTEILQNAKRDVPIFYVQMQKLVILAENENSASLVYKVTNMIARPPLEAAGAGLGTLTLVKRERFSGGEKFQITEEKNGFMYDLKAAITDQDPKKRKLSEEPLTDVQKQKLETEVSKAVENLVQSDIAAALLRMKDKYPGLDLSQPTDIDMVVDVVNELLQERLANDL